MLPTLLDTNRAAGLVWAAQAATTQAFLTGDGGTRYGAAVLTAAGHVFTAGQYSSFNHVTNVHAEQAALLLATMSGEPDVLALAVATTGSDEVARPCGICRQVFLEHARRTGRDFLVLMARCAGGHEQARVSELLPFAWLSHGAAPVEAPDVRPAPAPPPHATGPAEPGDHVLLPDGCVAMVWEPALTPRTSLLKIKYIPLPHGSGLRKAAHSFTEPLAHERELHALGWARPGPFGGTAAFASGPELTRLLPARPFEEVRDYVPAGLRHCLARAGVEESAVRVTGSRSLALHHSGSDWDLVVRLPADGVARLRQELARAVAHGEARIPECSGTWKALDRQFPGGREAVVAGGRFLETVEFAGTSVALILVPPGSVPVCVQDDWWPVGRMYAAGVVVDDGQAAYKRARFLLSEGESSDLEVVSFHKTANLVREGDRVAVRGWGLRAPDGRRRLVQLSPLYDNLVWLQKRTA
jgi:cytidine deaminase